MSLGGSNPSPSAIDSNPRSGIFLRALTFGADHGFWNTLGWMAFGLACLLLAAQAVRHVDPQDEGQFLTYPWLIAQGWMPYRDIWMSYPPAMYLILAALVKLGLPGLITERFVGVVVRLGYVLLVNRMVTGTWSRFSFIGVSVAYGLLFLASDIKTYPWIMALPLFVLGLNLIRSRSLAAGALFTAAGLFRFEYAAAGLLALIVLGLLEARHMRSWRRPLLGAFFLVALSVTIYLAGNLMTGGNLIRDAVFDQVGAVERARYIALWPPPFTFLGLPVLLVTVLGPLILIVIGLSIDRPAVTASNLAVLSLIPHFVQRADSSHLFQTGLIVIPWVVISLAGLVERGRARPRLHQVVRLGLGWTGLTIGAWCTLIIVAYAVYVSPFLPSSGESLANFTQRLVQGNGNATIAIDTAEARDDQQVVNYLNAHARLGQGVLIVPRTFGSQYTRTDLYSLLRLRPCTRYMEVQGGSFNSSGVQSEMVRNLPGCTWVLQVRGGVWYNPYARSATLPLASAIRRQYRTALVDSTYAVRVRRSS